MAPQPHEISLLSSRGQVVQQLRNLCLKVGNSRYKFVKRGPVNWAAFDWAKYESAIAILIDDSMVFPNAKGISTMTLSLEIFARLQGFPEEIDDGLMDKFYADAKQVLTELMQSKNSKGQPFVLRRHPGDNAIESHDSDLGVQGLIVTMIIDY